ncbi:MAG: hypothetical protein K6T54_06735 [Ignavibacterium sp.]|nr:hypothetical protein [Ignavibacterium sp.]
MKVLLSLLIIAAIAVGCSDNPTAPTNGGGIGGSGGGNTGSVVYTVSVVQDQAAQNYFEFKPNIAVTINTITANCPAAGVNNEQVTDDGTTVYDANNPAYVGPVNVLALGQQWTFTITGKIGSNNGASYSVTTNFTVR